MRSAGPSIHRYARNLALYRYCVYQATGGRYECFFRKVEEKLNRYIREAMSKGAGRREIRTLAITWGVQSAYFNGVLRSGCKTWGVAAVVDMLSLMLYAHG